MRDIAAFIRDHQLDAMRVGGQKIGAGRDRKIAVFNPYTEECLGHIPKAKIGRAHV